MPEQPSRSEEELARRANAIYEERIRPHVEAGHQEWIVAVDVETGHYALAESAPVAVSRLLAQFPEALFWCIQVGQKPLTRITVTTFLPAAQMDAVMSGARSAHVSLREYMKECLIDGLIRGYR